MKVFCDPLVIDNQSTAEAMKNFEIETVSQRQNEGIGEMMETERAEQNHFKRDENDMLSERARGSCISVQAPRASHSSDDVFQERTSLNLSLIHISEPTRPLYISYAVFCLKKD